MSHFAVLVIGDAPEEQLSMYDENLELPMHMVETKAEIIEYVRNRIERYKNGMYAEYLADPEKYKENHTNEAHIKYISEQFPKELEWDDEQCYASYIQDYIGYIEEGSTWCKIDDEGNLWKTTNEDAKWDWYSIGGRYRGLLKLKKPDPDAPLYSGWPWEDSRKEYERLKSGNYCDQAYVKDIVNLDEIATFAVLKDGEWHERGEMGWWCMVSNEKDEDAWEKEVRRLLADLPGDTLITVVDCHI